MTSWIAVTKELPMGSDALGFLAKACRDVQAAGCRHRVCRRDGVLWLERGPAPDERRCTCRDCHCRWVTTSPARQAACPKCGSNLVTVKRLPEPV